MNYFSKGKKVYKAEVKKVNKVLLQKGKGVPGKVIPAPTKLSNSIVGVKSQKTKKVFP